MPLLPPMPSLAALSTDSAAFLVEWCLKATLLLAFAAIAVLLLRRSSASLRHAVWTCAVVGVLALPLALWLPPTWSVPGLGFAALPSLPTVGALAGEAASKRLLPPPAVAPRSSRSAAVLGVDGGGPSMEAPAVPEGSPSAKGGSMSLAAGAQAGSARMGAPPRTHPGVLVLVIWSFGFLGLCGGALVGRIGLSGLTRDARPVRDPAWLGMADEARRLAGVRRPIVLLESERAAMPMTWGIFSPRVLLPAGAHGWPLERVRVVLLHELAHVRRWDCLTQTLAQLACAALWFHPALWYAARRLRVERERACDDFVLTAATLPSDYADHLLGVVRSVRGEAGQPLGALAFARPSQFEGRLVAVLDPRRRRDALTRGATVRLAAFATMALLGLASLDPWIGSPLAGGRETGSMEAHARRAQASRVVRAAEPASPLASRWDWALAEAKRDGEASFWVGYALRRSATGGDGLLSDVEGIDLATLDDAYPGPTLRDVLDGRERRLAIADREKDDGGLAVLIRLARTGGRVRCDRLRAQTFSIPADFGKRPLYWLGDAEEAASIALLDRTREIASRPEVRSKASGIVGYHAASDVVVPRLRGWIDSGDQDQRLEAIEGLGFHFSPETVEFLEQLAANDAWTDARREAVEALGRMAEDVATRALLDLARSTTLDTEVRQAVIEALGHKATEETASALEELVRIDEERAATGAVVAPEDPESPGSGGPAPHDPTDGPEKSGVAIDLEAAVAPEHDPDGGAAVHAGKATRKHARENGTPGDEDLAIQLEAVESLGQMGEEIGLPRLKALARSHPIDEVRRQAVESIGALGTEGAFGTLVLLAWKSSDPEVQRQAVESLGRFDGETAVKPLLDIARSHPSFEARRQAIETLGRYGTPQVAQSLEEVVRSVRDLDLALQAVESIGRLPEELAVSRLDRIARSHRDREVRRQAIETLGRSHPERALPVLEQILKVREGTSTSP